MMRKIKVAVSACLMGFRYRYDGEAKFNQELIDKLYERVELIPVCPEVECGLAVPREKMRLETSPKGIRLKVISTGEDVTDRMTEWAQHKLDQLEERDVAAFLFKAKSPSCGLHSTKIFDRAGRVITDTDSGIFARILTRRFPNMIVGQDVALDEFIRQLNLDLWKR